MARVIFPDPEDEPDYDPDTEWTDWLAAHSIKSDREPWSL